MKNKYDQFYTKPNIAKHCYDALCSIIDINNCTFLEPSAGEGVFLDFIGDNFLAYDIDPKDNRIKQLDYLNNDIYNEVLGKNIIVIGNPPFGKRSKIAIDFINKSFQYSNVIGFILPIQFNKYSAQSKIRSDAKLIYNEILPEDSFIYMGKSYSVRCCFQIWVNDDTIHKDIRLREKPVTTHSDFEMWQYNNTQEALKYFNKEKYQWDFAVRRQGYGDYNTKETNPEYMDKKTQWIFFKAKNIDVLNKLLNLDFETLSKHNTSTPGFGKADVIKDYQKRYEQA